MKTLWSLLSALLLAAAPFTHAAELADGEVRKIDREARKITLKHGEIKSIDMPPMTMVFQVRDVALLDAVKPGDRVKFAVEMVGSSFVVTEISAVK
jgi:Cu/Ag efflux protein CusF